ncbi:MAG: hypothetical protein ACRDOI_30550 [Trebonia sp.]
MVDASSLRGLRHGFHDYVDTAEMFTRIFDDLRARQITPVR